MALTLARVLTLLLSGLTLTTCKVNMLGIRTVVGRHNTTATKSHSQHLACKLFMAISCKHKSLSI